MRVAAIVIVGASAPRQRVVRAPGQRTWNLDLACGWAPSHPEREEVDPDPLLEDLQLRKLPRYCWLHEENGDGMQQATVELPI